MHSRANEWGWTGCTIHRDGTDEGNVLRTHSCQVKTMLSLAHGMIGDARIRHES